MPDFRQFAQLSSPQSMPVYWYTSRSALRFSALKRLIIRPGTSDVRRSSRHAVSARDAQHSDPPAVETALPLTARAA